MKIEDIAGIYRPNRHERWLRVRAMSSLIPLCLIPFASSLLFAPWEHALIYMAGAMSFVMMAFMIIRTLTWGCREVSIDTEKITIKRWLSTDEMLWRDVTDIWTYPRLLYWEGAITLVHRKGAFSAHLLAIPREYKAVQLIFEYAKANGIPIRLRPSSI